MDGYQRGTKASWDELTSGLRWLEPEHDTSLVRRRVEELQKNGSPVYCVWTRRRLRTNLAIDHCFPFAAWPCNDLWNLLPSHSKANTSKSDRLPTPELLERARPLVLEWWDSAYRQSPPLAQQFADESRSALPMAADDNDEVTPESVFESLMVQQMVLKRDQQLEEWQPAK